MTHVETLVYLQAVLLCNEMACIQHLALACHLPMPLTWGLAVASSAENGHAWQIQHVASAHHLRHAVDEPAASVGDVPDLNVACECHMGAAGCHATKLAPVSASVGHARRGHHPGSGVHDVEPAVGSGKQVD